MPRLLVHPGLPKTATTSLQRNILMPWHEAGRIRFLGRAVIGAAVHDPFEDIFDRIRARELSDDELDALRPEAEALLDPARLNVLSNERMSGMETVGLVDAEVLFHNLSRLFRRTEVRVLASLRSPVDFVLAAYAENYFWQFHARRPFATFPRFLDRLQREGEGSGAWLTCFPGAWLRALRRHFNAVAVLLHEDLANDPGEYFGRLAAELGADPAEVERRFRAERRNPGALTAAGRRSTPLLVQDRLRAVSPLWVQRSGAALLTRLPPLHRMYRRVARMRLRPVEHRFPDAATRERLQQLLGLRDDDAIPTFGVSAAKLARYNYLAPGDPSNAA